MSIASDGHRVEMEPDAAGWSGSFRRDDHIDGARKKYLESLGKAAKTHDSRICTQRALVGLFEDQLAQLLDDFGVHPVDVRKGSRSVAATREKQVATVGRNPGPVFFGFREDGLAHGAGFCPLILAVSKADVQITDFGLVGHPVFAAGGNKDQVIFFG